MINSVIIEYKTKTICKLIFSNTSFVLFDINYHMMEPLMLELVQIVIYYRNSELAPSLHLLQKIIYTFSYNN